MYRYRVGELLGHEEGLRVNTPALGGIPIDMINKHNIYDSFSRASSIHVFVLCVPALADIIRVVHNTDVVGHDSRDRVKIIFLNVTLLNKHNQ